MKQLRYDKMPPPRLKTFTNGKYKAATMTVVGEVDAVCGVAEAWRQAGKVLRWICTGEKTTIYFTRAFRIGVDEWPRVYADFHAEARKLISPKKRR